MLLLAARAIKHRHVIILERGRREWGTTCAAAGCSCHPSAASQRDAHSPPLARAAAVLQTMGPAHTFCLLNNSPANYYCNGHV